MLLSPISFYILATLSLLSSTYAIGVSPREACAEKYTPCSPPGATNSVVPPVGDALSGLYFDLVSSVNPQPVIRAMAADHALNQIQRTASTICCEWEEQYSLPHLTHIPQVHRVWIVDCFRATALRSAG
jgi:hypothetical protein